MSPGAGFDLHPLESVKLPDVIENDLADVPPAGIAMAKPSPHQNIVMHDEWKRTVQAYLASVSFVDAPIGRLLDAAERRASKRDFIIVLWSDHGWNLGQKEHWHKVALWENTTHVPLIMSVPGITEPGSRCERPVDLLSLKVATFKGGRSRRPDHRARDCVRPLLLRRPTRLRQQRWPLTYAWGWRRHPACGWRARTR